MATKKRPASSKEKDSVTHAPEAGEPKETPPRKSKQNVPGDTAKSKIGNPRVGEADES